MIAAMRERQRDREMVPGLWVKALRRELGRQQGLKRPLSQMKLAILLRRDRNTVARWEAPDVGEVDWVVWVGALALAKMPINWEPSAADLEAAQGETEDADD